MEEPATFADKRRLLQLETLHDLSLAVHAERDEQDLLEELLGRVCLVLDPATAIAVTRDPAGGARAAAVVGWPGREPDGDQLLKTAAWSDLLAEGEALSRRGGTFAGVAFRELIAAPLVFRETYWGYLALLDKEERGGLASEFSGSDRRFLASVGRLAGVAVDSARHLDRLEGERERLFEENKALRDRFAAEIGGRKIVAHAAPMRELLELVERIAPRGVNVLVRGESGTGKELVAKLLHHLSGRSGSLVAINCGAVPETLLESELFGIEGGVATGVAARRGKFELADGGTLFLDELGDMPPMLQVKLLRALQEREVVRVGAETAVQVDVRVVAATHRDLDSLVADGRLREDLYYRLKGVELVLPPLRERREDVPHLVRHFLAQFCAREGIAVPTLTRGASALLLEHDYPGNVRELQNLVEGAASLADGTIDVELLRSLLGRAEAAAPGPEALDLASVERRHIQRVLQRTRGNKTSAARLLGVDRKTLTRKGF